LDLLSSLAEFNIAGTSVLFPAYTFRRGSTIHRFLARRRGLRKRRWRNWPGMLRVRKLLLHLLLELLDLLLQLQLLLHNLLHPLL